MNTIDVVAGNVAAHQDKKDDPPGEPKSGEIKLTNEERMSLELLLTKKRLAEAELQLAMVAMKEAQRKLVAYSRDEAVVMSRIRHQHGLANVKSLKLLGDSIRFELE